MHHLEEILPAVSTVDGFLALAVQVCREAGAVSSSATLGAHVTEHESGRRYHS